MKQFSFFLTLCVLLELLCAGALAEPGVLGGRDLGGEDEPLTTSDQSEATVQSSISHPAEVTPVVETQSEQGKLGERDYDGKIGLNEMLPDTSTSPTLPVTSRTESSVREVVGRSTEIINIDGLDVPLSDGSSVYIPFVDIAKDAYYAEAVAWAYKHDPQITAGVTDLSFGPSQTCTRGQMVTFLWRAAGCPEPSGDASRFVDVAAGAYYAKAVAWAVENNITTGISPKYFAPDGIVNRAQTVTFLYRAKGKPAVTSAAQFTDVAAGEYYADAVAWAVANGITNGVSPKYFGPDSNCVRGQTVTFLYRAYK